MKSTTDQSCSSGVASSKEPAVQITPCPNGPLLVRGNIEIIDPVTNEIVRPGRTVALCRCGVSAIKPFCDGTHKLVNFTTTAEETTAEE